MKLSVAYSPCPNDTFVFYGVAMGRVPLPRILAARGGSIETYLHDVETLNRLALEQTYDVTKLSFCAWLHVQDTYQMLRVGTTLGRGCGPLMVDKPVTGGTRPFPRRVALPGERTTAHLLFRLWAPEPCERVFVPYDRIMPLVASGEVDAGVIIHEGRFVYRQQGLVCRVDLGEWWENETGLPIPLGCLAARKPLGAERIAACESLIESSLRLALADPQAPRDYVRQNAQELDDAVTRRHIETYVNAYSLDLGETGRVAIAELETRARKAGLLS